MNSGDPRARGFRQRSEVAAVLAELDARFRRISTEVVAPVHAAGRVLAASVDSPVSVPSFPRSAMDGYALIAEQTFGASAYSPERFRVVGDSFPGRGYQGSVQSGDAVRIMTGAPVPQGADAVLPFEETEAGADERGRWMEAKSSVAPKRNVAAVGEDLSAGERLFKPGRVLRPQDVGLLCSVGLTEVTVTRRPKVDVLATGNELLPAGSTPQDYRIVDSNSPMLAALVERDGGILGRHEIVPDTREDVVKAIGDSTSDVVLVTGGSSVGVEDHVPSVVAELGELFVHGVALRPAAPTGIGSISGRAVFLLPGNPVSCLCAYDLFAGRVIRVLGGHGAKMPYETQVLPAARKITSASGRVDYARVSIQGAAVEPIMVSGASILSSTTKADGFVVVDQDAEGIDVGEEVLVHLYG